MLVIAAVLLVPAGAEEHATGLAPLGREAFEALVQNSRALEASPSDRRPRAARMPDPAHDLSRNMPPVRTQGQQPSCVAWATGYYLKSYQEAVEQKWDLKDPAHVFSPAYVFNQTLAKKKTADAITLPEAFRLLQERGCATLAEFPYDPGDTKRLPPLALQREAASYRIQTWHALDYQKLDQLKALLADDIPVIAGMMIDQEFDYFRGGRKLTSYDPKTLKKYHAMCLVAYDDAKAAFKIVNSWGPDWGDAGYAWIDYSLFTNICLEAYYVEDALNSAIFRPEQNGIPVRIERTKVSGAAEQGGRPGVLVQSRATVRGWAKRPLVAEALFYWDAGNPLPDQDGRFATDRGQVCVKKEFTPESDQVEYEDLALFLPHDQLDLAKRGQYALKTLMILRPGASNSDSPLAEGPFVHFRFEREFSAQLAKVWLEHRVRSGDRTGLRLHAELEIHGLIGKQARIVARLRLPGGMPLDGGYTGAEGEVVASAPASCSYDINYFADFPLFVPYSQLHPADTPSTAQVLEGRIEVLGPSGVLAASEWVPFRYTPGIGSEDALAETP